MLSQINTWVKDSGKDIEMMYNYLHSIAEISWEEKETTKFICDELKRLDIPYTTFKDHTGVVALWEGNSVGPTIALRADIDALWQNVDGVWKANHSCGHDAHTTMVLNTLKCLKAINFNPTGRLKVIFQPAEESGKGAEALIEKGVVDDIDFLLGIHVRPIQELSFLEASSAIYHGATTLLKGKVKGMQAHASRPNLGINVVDAIAAIINAVNSVKVDPTIVSSVKVTMVHTNNKNLNIIPDEAEFGIDVRAATNEAMEDLIKKVKLAVFQAGSSNGSEIGLQVAASMPAAVPNKFMENVVGEAITDILGKDGFALQITTPGGEDFHFYSKNRPSIKSTMIGLGTDLAPGLHHPKMHFNLDSLHIGVRILALSTLKLFDYSMHEIVL